MGPTAKYDVIVIGGGPGGSSVATFLAQAGKKVLLLEKENFPRYHIGESLLSGTVTLLEKLGVLGKIEKAGYLRKNGVSWVWGKDRAAWTVYFKDAVAIPHDFGFQVERGPFDQLLLENAREHGVEALEGRTATELVWDGDRLIGLRYRKSGADAPMTAEAAWIVDASGQSCFLTKQIGKRTWDDHLRNMALWSYWKNAKRPEGVDRGNTFLPTFREGWWWFIPLRDEITSVGAVIDRDNYEKAQQMGLKAFYLDAIERTPEIAERLKDATMIEEMRVTRDWSYSQDSFCGKGYFAVGDTACFIDPLLSTGVHLAILSGYLAALSINTLLEEPDMDEGPIQTFYQEQYRREYARLREKVYFMYGGHKAMPDSYFWNARKIFDIPTRDPKKSFISLIAGAFEHRSWYRRFSRQLEVPDHVHELADSIFAKQNPQRDGLFLDKPLVRSPEWAVKDDFAVEGRRLKPAKILISADGRTFPLDDTMAAILTELDGTTTCLAMVEKLAGGDESKKNDVRSHLSEAVAFGILTLADT